MKKAGALGLGLAILGVVVPAAGSDTKSIHGAVCQPGSLGSLSYNAYYGAAASGGEAYAICPLMRDRINSTTTLSSAVVEFFIPGGGFAYCSLYSQTEDGSYGYVDYDTQEANTSGAVQLSFHVDSTAGNEGTYGLFCDLSNGTYIAHIHTNESTGTGSN